MIIDLKKHFPNFDQFKIELIGDFCKVTFTETTYGKTVTKKAMNSTCDNITSFFNKDYKVKDVDWNIDSMGDHTTKNITVTISIGG